MTLRKKLPNPQLPPKIEETPPLAFKTPQVLMFGNNKGGVGKTAMATAMGFFARHNGINVIFIDADPQANSSMVLSTHIDREAPASSLFSEDPELIHGEGLSLYRGDEGLILANSKTESIGNFVNAIEALLNTDDLDPNTLIIIDTAPTTSSLQVGPLAVAKFVVVPMALHNFAIVGLSTMIRLIEQVKEASNPELQMLGVIPTLVQQRGAEQKALLSQMQTEYPEYLLDVSLMIGHRSIIARSLSEQKPIWQTSGSGKAAATAELDAVTSTILTRMGATS